jgi:outer membrane protein
MERGKYATCKQMDHPDGFGCFLGSWIGLCADVAKIGVVEFQRLFENSVAGKEIKAKITTQGKKMEAELKEKALKLRK